MKKSNVMRMLSLVLVLTLISTCAISGTFAKYTTQDSAADNARVAKWGVALQVAGNLYGDHYAINEQAPSTYATLNTASVTAFTEGTDVVAPGTKNDTGIAFSINGQPEVSGVITATIEYENIYLKGGKYGVIIPLTVNNAVDFQRINAAAGSDDTKKLYKSGTNGYTVATTFEANTQYYTLEDYVEVPDTYYYPVEYKMTGTTSSYNTGFSTATSVDQIAAIAALVGAKFGNIDSNTLVAGKTTITYEGTAFNPNQVLSSVMELEDQVITWKWDFENDGSTVGDEASWQDRADTILGNLQAVDGSEAFAGTVVKYDTNAWKAPVAAAEGNLNDYNLETCFGINITATQVD